ncbi:hypothetical protein [Salinivirga cyanobacteriivorans]
MKKITHILLFAMLFLAFVPTQAQKGKKVIESSERRAPDWVNGLEKNYIIIVGTGATLEDAKQDALLRIKEKIIRAVAENVQFESQMDRKEEMLNNISNYAETYESTTKTQATDVSFVKGIALNKAEAFYWEKVKDKSTDKVTAHYHVKYPFSSIELKKLVMAFEKKDRELTEQLNSILNEVPTMNSVERMEGAIKELQQLQDRFMGPRKDQAATGVSRIITRLKSITIHPEVNRLGLIEYSLRVGDQTIKASKKPRVLNPNQCATIKTVQPTESGWKIKYDPQYCYEDPNNLIRVMHNIRHNRLQHDFHFNINAEKVEIYMHSDILVNAETVTDTAAKDITFTFNIASKYESPFTIESIVLKYDNLAPISFNNINRTFSGKGEHELKLKLDKELEIDKYSSNKESMVNGMIYYKGKESGERDTYKLYKHNITTNF